MCCLVGRLTQVSGVEEALQAEAAGLGAVYVSERLDVKDAAVVAGAIAASTSEVRIGTAVVHEGTRHPLTMASMASTLQLLSGGRFTLGLGRGLGALAPSLGVAKPTLASIEHLVSTVRRLWLGERISESGPAGSFRGLRFSDLPPAPLPPILFGTIGPRGLALAGRCFDGAILHPFLTPEAVARSARTIRDAAEASGRDPGAIRIVATVVCAPGLSPEREAIAARARAISYLQVRGLGELLVETNDWNPEVLQAIRDHPTLVGQGHCRHVADPRPAGRIVGGHSVGMVRRRRSRRLGRSLRRASSGLPRRRRRRAAVAWRARRRGRPLRRGVDGRHGRGVNADPAEIANLLARGHERPAGRVSRSRMSPGSRVATPGRCGRSTLLTGRVDGRGGSCAPIRLPVSWATTR